MFKILVSLPLAIHISQNIVWIKIGAGKIPPILIVYISNILSEKVLVVCHHGIMRHQNSEILSIVLVLKDHVFSICLVSIVSLNIIVVFSLVLDLSHTFVGYPFLI